MTRVHWIEMGHFSQVISKDAITYSRLGRNSYDEWVVMFMNLAMGDQDVYNYPLLF